MSKKPSRSAKRVKMLVEPRVEDSSKILKPLAPPVRLRLSPFASVPLEILYEFCGYLNPLDLLHLARTSSSLRIVLLSKAARQLWIHSFDDLKQKGFPDCPADLSEPQYANLMLSVYCHNCLRDDGDTTYYLIILGRTRLCFNCARKSYVPFKLNAYPPSEILRYIPYTELTFFSCEYEASLSVYQANSDYVAPFNQCSYKAPPSRASPHDLSESFDYFRQRKYSVTDAQAMTREYRALGKDQVKKKAWKKRCEERRQMLWAHGTAWVQYERVWLQEQQEAKQALIDARIASIRQKLVDVGWEEELTFLEAFAQPPESLGCKQFHWRKFEGVAKPVPLTEEEWRKLHFNLEPWFKGTREERLYQEKASTVKARIQEYVEPIYRDFILSESGDDPFPSIAEVCLIPQICTVLEDTTVEVTQSMLDATTAALPDFVQGWRRDREEEFLMIMRKSNAYSSSKLAPTAESLRYASTVFKCDPLYGKTHNEPCTIAYPEVLVHPCCLVQASALQLPRPSPPEGPQKARGGLWRKAKDKRVGISTTPKPPPKAGDLICTALEDHLVFVLRDISFGEAAFVHTEALLELCKLPSTTTVAELQKLDPYVVTKCGCFSPDLLLRWASAARMSGSKSHHRKPIDPERIFTLPSEEHQAIVEEMRSSRRDDWDIVDQYYCVLCSEFIPNILGAVHLEIRHKLSSEAANQFLSMTLIDGGPSEDFRRLPEKAVSKTGSISAAEIKSLALPGWWSVY
ncbi:hypothetical protein BKA70DRAFT_1567797 [Coprinopsis sp. MPI-PUGE-AT-0042]|nr:hypothetical protein BKA70DRAFT_1570519 [Coprinopsis sp. MPI-PUGE-AT-0042]KAH6902300.1 hypothetical protein BKA70DRAFT_1567797 [Coprinopsis sp. MPI-PUGE-AT-0042]